MPLLSKNYLLSVTAALREVVERKTNDRLVQLREALAIADASGINEPVVLSERLPAKYRLKSAAENEALCTLWVRNLSAEIGQIQERENKDAFITDLRDLELRATYLGQIDLATVPFETFSSDREIYVPQVAKPSKSGVLLVAGLVGLMLGLALAVAREIMGYLNKRKYSAG